MKAAFFTLGCKLNYAETSTYERALAQAGIDVAGQGEKADVCIINTCSVTSTADAKSRNLIRRVHRSNPSAAIFVTGCSAQLRADEIRSIPGVSRVFGAGEKGEVAPAILQAAGIPVERGSAAGHLPEGIFPAYSTGERTRSFLKVQDGCDNFCKYCTVPYARGESRNVPVCECVRCAEAIAAEGVKEIVLTGVNTGDFGKSTGESFLELLRRLDGVEGIERYRISSIEPNLLTRETIDWIASGTKFQPHFHIPLQAGSDEILSAMGRRYDTAFFADLLAYIRKVMEVPGGAEVFFGIDVMAGLPGETDALFGQSMDFLRSVRPSYIHVFPYSRRPGTPAASMKGQVPERVRTERVKALQTLCGELHEGFALRHRGMTLPVLFESSERDGTMGGYTPNYIRVTRPFDGSLSGKIVPVTL